MDGFSLIFALFTAASFDPEAARLIPLLGHDNFAVREKAASDLGKLEGRALGVLARAKNHPDPEIARKSSLLLERILTRELASFGEMPWIDALWSRVEGGKFMDFACSSEDSLLGAKRRTFEPFLDFCGKSGHPDYVSYRWATRIVVEQWLREGVPTLLIRKTLEEMHGRDEAWRKK